MLNSKGSQGGIVIIEEGAVFYNTKNPSWEAWGVHIKKTHPRGIRNTKIEMACIKRTNLFFIDEGCSIESSRFSMVNEK